MWNVGQSWHYGSCREHKEHKGWEQQDFGSHRMGMVAWTDAWGLVQLVQGLASETGTKMDA